MKNNMKTVYKIVMLSPFRDTGQHPIFVSPFVPKDLRIYYRPDEWTSNSTPMFVYKTITHALAVLNECVFTEGAFVEIWECETPEYIEIPYIYAGNYKPKEIYHFWGNFFLREIHQQPDHEVCRRILINDGFIITEPPPGTVGVYNLLLKARIVSKEFNREHYIPGLTIQLHGKTLYLP